MHRLRRTGTGWEQVWRWLEAGSGSAAPGEKRLAKPQAKAIPKTEWFCNVGGDTGQGKGVARRSAPKGGQAGANFPSRMTLMKPGCFHYWGSLTA